MKCLKCVREWEDEWDQTFHTQLSAGSGIGRREINGSCHVHVHVVEDKHVPHSFFFHFNILQTNKRQSVNAELWIPGYMNLTVVTVEEQSRGKLMCTLNSL